MLRCGLRVEETAGLKLDDLDLRRGTIIVRSGKGAKGRMVYMSTDAHSAIKEYLRVRQTCQDKSSVSGGQGSTQRQADLGSWHPEKAGAVCQKIRLESLLS